MHILYFSVLYLVMYISRVIDLHDVDAVGCYNDTSIPLTKKIVKKRLRQSVRSGFAYYACFAYYAEIMEAVDLYTTP